MSQLLNKKDLVEESLEILKFLKDDDLDNAKLVFEKYQRKWEEYQELVPFIKSTEEYLYDSFAKEKGITSLKIIEDNFSSDIFGTI